MKRGSAELGEGLAQAADRLRDALLVLDQREPHETFATGAEPAAWRHRDLRLLHEQGGELLTRQLGVGLGNRRPDEHRALGTLDRPAEAIETVDQRVAPTA